MKRFALLFALPAFCIITLRAGSIYVSPAGNDSAEGTLTKPMKTPALAVRKLKAGDTLYFREGRYFLTEQFAWHPSGQEGAPVVYTGFPGEKAVLDASAMQLPVVERRQRPGLYHQGAVQLTGVHWLVIRNLIIEHSPLAGIGLWNSSHIDVLNVTTNLTFAPGICAWPGCEYIRVMGCTITGANSHKMNRDTTRYPTSREAPHEALSMCASHFEVAWNHIHHCDKEGIDVKETASHGKVHHNYIHHLARQGLYVDSWFGKLEDIELYENVVHDCVTGFAVSAEGGPVADNIYFHHNLLYDNIGCGIFFSRWGKDNLRTNIVIKNNTVVHCGYGDGTANFWLRAGGCYLYSEKLYNIHISDNVFCDNWPFQIGVSSLLNKKDTFKSKMIRIESNLIDDRVKGLTYPVYLEWPRDSAYRYDGADALYARITFMASDQGNFTLKKLWPGSNTEVAKGAFPQIIRQGFWWKESFPPEF